MHLASPFSVLVYARGLPSLSVMLAVTLCTVLNPETHTTCCLHFSLDSECELLKGHSVGAWASGDAPYSHGY